jgi:hypothetical protein
MPKSQKPRKPYGGPIWSHLRNLQSQQNALAEIVTTHANALARILQALAPPPPADSIQAPTPGQIQLVNSSKEKS